MLIYRKRVSYATHCLRTTENFDDISLLIQEGKSLFYSFLLAATTAAPRTVEWSPAVGLTMIICNLVAVAIGRYAIQKRGVGPKLPVEGPALFEGFGVAELLATASFGHILGAGVILGLSNAGVL